MGTDLGRVLIITGALLLILGLVVVFAARIPGIGRLPGDIVYRKGNFTFYFPVVTCILLSLVLSLVWRLFRR